MTWKIRKCSQNVLEGPLYNHLLKELCRHGSCPQPPPALPLQPTETRLLCLRLYFVSKVRRLLVPHLNSACCGLGSLSLRLEVGNLHFSAQGLGSVSWKRELVRPLPLDGFTPVVIVEH